MKQEEAISRGIKVRGVLHSMKRRSPWHDYCKKGTYMLTLVVQGRRPLFGRIVEIKPESGTFGNSGILPHSGTFGNGGILPHSGTVGNGGEVRVELTELGRIIKDVEIKKISQFYPMVEVWKVCMMPDHIHFIVRVKEDLPKGVHLGKIIAGFKLGCHRAYKPESGTFGNGGVERLFEVGYNDKILLEEGQLDRWKTYLDDNPRRCLIKKKKPQLFTVLHDMEIIGRRCQIVGNCFLLDIPDKVAVIVHSRYTDEEKARFKKEWLACGERGGVLVGTAIASEEKEVLREAMDLGYKIILLRENGFPQLYKPSGESFYACAEGRLLQISPWKYHMEQNRITRGQCLELNEMAERIVDTPQRN